MKKFSRAFIFFSIAYTLFVEGTINDKNVRMDQLDRLWHIDKNEYMRYYDFFLNGKHFKGEKLLEPRWNSIKKLVSFKGKKVLELGANIGIFAVLLAKHTSSYSSASKSRQSTGN